jgi:hypothetical protein
MRRFAGRWFAHRLPALIPHDSVAGIGYGPRPLPFDEPLPENKSGR